VPAPFYKTANLAGVPPPPGCTRGRLNHKQGLMLLVNGHNTHAMPTAAAAAAAIDRACCGSRCPPLRDCPCYADCRCCCCCCCCCCCRRLSVLWTRVPHSTQLAGPPELAPSWAGRQPLLLPTPAAMQARQHSTSWIALHPTYLRHRLVEGCYSGLCWCKFWRLRL
jgi:hypothetical protein